MLRLFKFIAALLLLAAAFNNKGNAQGTGTADVPRIISYQGQLTTANGLAMNGTHQITATLYSNPHGTKSVWQGSYDVSITNGLFSLQLGSGTENLPENSIMNKPLWIGIKVDEGEEMQPLTPLSAAPYALNVPDQSITMAKLAPDVVLGTMQAPKTQAILSDPCSSNNDGGVASNVVAGGCVNVADPAAGYASIGGGQSNQARAEYATVAGGYGNQATNFASSALSGYESNVTGQYSTVAGGFLNQALSADYASIVGGSGNTIGNGQYTFIGGGYGNGVSDNYSSVVGGKSNSTSNTAQYSSIGGGYTNIITGNYSAIPGGRNLTVGTSSFGFNGGSSAVDVSSSGSIAYFGDVDLWLGNDDNTARKLKFYEPSTSGTNFTSFAAQAQSADISYILPAAQGAANSVLSNNGSGTLSWAPASGTDWSLTGNLGTSPPTNFLGTTDFTSLFMKVNNTIGFRIIPQSSGTNKTPAIAGGSGFNTILIGSEGATIAGGGDQNNPNVIGVTADADFAFIGAGDGNTIDASSFESVITGGRSNSIGLGNTTGTQSFIGGGVNNAITANQASIPGGESLIAQSYAQTVLGSFNQPQGTSNFNSDFMTTPHVNDRIFIIGNGHDPTFSGGPVVRSNAFEVSNNGHSIVYDKNPTSTTTAIEGARYRDNTCIAWGNITALGGITSGFGLSSIPPPIPLPIGTYTITLDYTDPNTGAQVQIGGGSSVVATLVFGADFCANVQVEPITWNGTHNQFKVHTFIPNVAGGICTVPTFVNEPFMFHVYARP